MDTQSKWNTLYDVLAHQYRRAILHHLLQTETASVDELVSAVHQRAEGRKETTPTNLEEKLHHHHLPKLAMADLVVYDANDATVTATIEETEDVTTLLEAAATIETKSTTQ